MLKKNLLHQNWLNQNLNRVGLRKVAFRDVANPSPPTAPIPLDLWRRLRACWKRLRRWSQRAPRRLRLCDSLPLGERRFVAVVEFESARFLLGGTSSSLVLLARLGNDRAQDGEDEKEKKDRDRDRDQDRDQDQDQDQDRDQGKKHHATNKHELAPPTLPATGIFTRFEP